MHVVPTKHLDGPSNIVTFHCEVTVISGRVPGPRQ